jgi:hypothetical protein
MYVKENPLRDNKIEGLSYFERGWGNGYVFIDFSHPLWGDEAKRELFPICIHGGITFNQKVDRHDWIPGSHWGIGFNTAHYNDTLQNWPKERVELETKELFCQLMEIEMGEL